MTNGPLCGPFVSLRQALLSTTPSVLSGAVSRLEARLGWQLLRRTTRRVWLSVPTTYGHYRLPPCWRALRSTTQVKLNITNRNVDLVAEGFDLAICLGQLPDSGLVVRKLEDAPLLVAAPDYLQRRGKPQTLDDLQQHLCLHFVMPRTGRLAPWIFRDGGCDVNWLPRSSIETSDDVLGMVSPAEQGIGSARAMSSSCGSDCCVGNWWKFCRSRGGGQGRLR